jgi:LmbE family N-acetylglucosaminyl deacetylase
MMAILAHPDDESLGNGAALARYSAEGVEITLVTATRGQRGCLGDPVENPGLEALGRIREAELQAAGAVLDLREVVVLDYVDGELDQADPEQIICDLVAHFRRVQPQVILTWGPDGGYGHPDHIAIGQFATAAVMRAADPRYGHTCTTRRPHAVSKLYYMALSAEHAAAYIRAFGDVAMDVDGVQRRLVIAPDWLITTRIDAGEEWRRGWQAVTSHRSQLPNYAHLADLPPDQQRQLWGHNTYCRAFSTVNGGRTAETDLFEGLRAPAATGFPRAA